MYSSRQTPKKDTWAKVQMGRSKWSEKERLCCKIIYIVSSFILSNCLVWVVLVRPLYGPKKKHNYVFHFLMSKNFINQLVWYQMEKDTSNDEKNNQRSQQIAMYSFINRTTLAIRKQEMTRSVSGTSPISVQYLERPPSTLHLRLIDITRFVIVACGMFFHYWVVYRTWLMSQVALSRAFPKSSVGVRSGENDGQGRTCKFSLHLHDFQTTVACRSHINAHSNADIRGIVAALTFDWVLVWLL